MAKLNENYETIMIFSVTEGDDKTAEIVEKFKTRFETGATVTEAEEWGRRKLAYPINDEPEGFYYLVRYSASPDFPDALNEEVKVTNGILRTLTVTTDKK